MTRGGFSDEVPFEQDLNEAKKPDTQRPRGQNDPGGGNRKHTHLEAGLSGSVHGTQEGYTPRGYHVAYKGHTKGDFNDYCSPFGGFYDLNNERGLTVPSWEAPFYNSILD